MAKGVVCKKGLDMEGKMGGNRFCVMCGNALDEGAKFCGSCGQAVQSTSENVSDSILPRDNHQEQLTELDTENENIIQTGNSSDSPSEINKGRRNKREKPTKRKARKKKGGCLKKFLVGIVVLVFAFIGLGLLLPEPDTDYTGEDVFQGSSSPNGDISVGDTSVGDGENSSNNSSGTAIDDTKQAEYTFMVYLNGTDLERDGGAGTSDLVEMAKVGSTPEVNVVVETGGTEYWRNELVDGSQNQRFLVKKDDLEIVESIGLKNMGDPETLYDFIVWSIETYPADKYVLDLWNHGGGPMYGFGSDDHFTVETNGYEHSDHLTLDEIESALRRAKEETGIKFEVIGFDACLMATIETAYMVEPYANYLVASEEEEPGHGWDYTGILKALTESPKMDGNQLGTIICDTFKTHAEYYERDSMITLSVVDLSYISEVVLALEDLSVDFMMNMADVETFNTVSNGRNNAEAYGRNNMFTGYTELVDLYDFARRVDGDHKMAAQALMQSIDRAVVYKIQGPSRNYSGGLSIYFPYKDKSNLDENLSQYKTVNTINMYETFIEEFVRAEKGDVRAPVLEVFVPEEIEDNIYSITISEEDRENIASIYNYLGYVLNEEKTAVMSLGMDTNVNYDPNTGVVTDNFQGYWTGLNGRLVTIYVVEDNDEYNLYNIPAYINGQRADIVGKWTWDDTYDDNGYYSVLGAWAVSDSGEIMAEKDFMQLKIGDVIEPIFEAYNGETYEKKEASDEPFTLEEEAYLDFLELPTGETYMYGFYIVDYAQNGTFSGFEMFNYID